MGIGVCLLGDGRNTDYRRCFWITIQGVTSAVTDVEKRREGDKGLNSKLKRIKESIGAQKQSV